MTAEVVLRQYHDKVARLEASEAALLVENARLREPDWRQEAILGNVPSDTWMVVGSILGYSAHCHCGWASTMRNDGPQAHKDLVEHWLQAHRVPDMRKAHT